MNISDIIENFIQETVEECGGSAEIRRSELAIRFGCVPSQINYVLSTRFTADRGYVIESRRGGGGHILIKRLVLPENSMVMHTVSHIGDTIDFPGAKRCILSLCRLGLASEREASLMLAALSDRALRCDGTDKNRLRASILKNMLLTLI